MPQMWNFPSHLDHLHYLNIAQLRNLLEDEDSVQCMVMVNTKFQSLQRQTEVKCSTNRRLAQRNMSYQPQLTHYKVLLAEKYHKLGKIVHSVRQKQRRLESFNRRLSLKVTKQFVKERLANVMEESEGLWKTFLEGKLLLNDFVESFRATRMFYHKQLVQLEKLSALKTHRTLEAFYPRETDFSTRANAIFSFVMLPSSILPLMPPSLTPALPHLPPLHHHGSNTLSLTGYKPPGHLQELKRLQRKHTKKSGDCEPSP